MATASSRRRGTTKLVRRVRALCLVLSALVPAHAMADGRTEINQVTIDAAGGFPFSLSAPGSYVLTGDLVVASDVAGFQLTGAGPLAIDFNGFSLTGATTCDSRGCVAGIWSGIRGGAGISATVHDGTIQGFSGPCLTLGSHAEVRNMSVRSCGQDGVRVTSGLVVENRVADTGRRGLDLGAGAAFAHNVISDFNRLVGGWDAVEGGRATGGNVCSDGSCEASEQASWGERIVGTERFVLVMDGEAVLDRETDLVWERVPLTGHTNVWQDALAHCLNLRLGGRLGWRLPAIHELATLVDPAVLAYPTLPPGHPFTIGGAVVYRSSTTNIGDPTSAYHLSLFTPGGVSSFPKSGFQIPSGAVPWCVRGGAHGLLDQ